jgi:DNA damage-binding protein 1
MASQAFEVRDAAASRAAHSAVQIAERHSEDHSVVGSHLRSIVYGGLDGIITTFAVVAGATGGSLDSSVILILGTSSIAADSLSMSLGAVLSERADREMVWREREREEWELQNFPEGEKAEMVEVYTKRGLPEDKARLIVDAMAETPDFLIDQMVVDELGLRLPDPDDSPLVQGLVTFVSFVAFGIVPLLGYICLEATGADDGTMFAISCGLTATMMFVLGVVKSQFTRQAWWLAGLEILVLGGLTAGAAYGIGAAVAGVV